MRSCALLLLALLTAIPFLTLSSGDSGDLKEVHYFSGGWTRGGNVTVFDVLYPADLSPLLAQFRVVSNGTPTEWMEANLTREGDLVNLYATIHLEEGEYLFYQFRLLLNGEEIYISPQRGVGFDGTPPDIKKVEVPQNGGYVGLPPVTLKVDFGPSGPGGTVRFVVCGNSWNTSGFARLFLGDDVFVVAEYHFLSPPGTGQALITLNLTDGAGNSAFVSFSGNFTDGGSTISGLWPKGGILKESLLRRGMVVRSSSTFEKARLYLFDYARNVSRTLSVVATPGENDTYFLSSGELDGVLEGVLPGRYTWQVVVEGKGLFSPPANFTVIGTLKSINLGLPRNARGGSVVALSPGCEILEGALLDLDHIEARVRDPAGDDMGWANLSLLPGPLLELPPNPHTFPLYYVFPTGECLRVEPENWRTSVRLHPGQFPEVILGDDVGGIDTASIRLEVDNRSVTLKGGIDVLEMGEVSSGVLAPILVSVSLKGILPPSSANLYYRDLLLNPAEHKVVIRGEDLPPAPHVVSHREGDVVVLRVVCEGYGELEPDSVNLFKVVGSEASPPSEEVRVNVSDAIRISSRERMEVLVEILIGQDKYYWRGEIGPFPWPEPEIRWKQEGGRVRLWIANLPPGVENVTWQVGGNRVVGRSITVSMEVVKGKRVEAEIRDLNGSVMIVEGGVVEIREEGGGWSPYPPLIVDAVLLVVLLSLLLYPYLGSILSRLTPVEMEIERTGGGKSKRRKVREAGREGLYRCAICLNPITPEEEYVKCTCGARFHRRCAMRVGVCPRCGGEIMVEDSFF